MHSNYNDNDNTFHFAEKIAHYNVYKQFKILIWPRGRIFIFKPLSSFFIISLYMNFIIH